MKFFDTSKFSNAVKNAETLEYGGRISQILGLTVEAAGFRLWRVF